MAPQNLNIVKEDIFLIHYKTGCSNAFWSFKRWKGYWSKSFI